MPQTPSSGGTPPNGESITVDKNGELKVIAPSKTFYGHFGTDKGEWITQSSGNYISEVSNNGLAIVSSSYSEAKGSGSIERTISVSDINKLFIDYELFVGEAGSDAYSRVKVDGTEIDSVGENGSSEAVAEIDVSSKDQVTILLETLDENEYQYASNEVRINSVYSEVKNHYFDGAGQ